VMMVVTLITAAAHLAQIALWAVALMLCGEIATFEKALYCSTQNYTALGYGDVPMSERWRLLGPLEAINGLLLVGLSTAGMFGVLSRLIKNNVCFQEMESTPLEHLTGDGRAHSSGANAPGLVTFCQV